MSYDQNHFDVELQRRIKEAGEHLRKLPDDELMRLHEGIYDQPEEKEDAAFMVAIYKETQRRYTAVGWIWRRLFRRQEYEKWVAHQKMIEAKATQRIINILQKYDDSTSQEVIRRLKGL